MRLQLLPLLLLPLLLALVVRKLLSLVERLPLTVVPGADSAVTPMLLADPHAPTRCCFHPPTVCEVVALLAAVALLPSRQLEGPSVYLVMLAWLLQGHKIAERSFSPPPIAAVAI